MGLRNSSSAFPIVASPEFRLAVEGSPNGQIMIDGDGAIDCAFAVHRATGLEPHHFERPSLGALMVV